MLKVGEYVAEYAWIDECCVSSKRGGGRNERLLRVVRAGTGFSSGVGRDGAKFSMVGGGRVGDGMGGVDV